jgi:hypothetical protein
LIAVDSPEGDLVNGDFMLVKLTDNRNIPHYIAKAVNDFRMTSGMTEASTTSGMREASTATGKTEASTTSGMTKASTTSGVTQASTTSGMTSQYDIRCDSESE